MANEKIELVKMNRSIPPHPGGPIEADVHPDEVTNYAAGGWGLTQEPKQPKEPKAPKEPKEPKPMKE